MLIVDLGATISRSLLYNIVSDRGERNSEWCREITMSVHNVLFIGGLHFDVGMATLF